MSSHQPKLVNKQFNSPIGLYSNDNIKEILDRESQMLSNGAVGINFHNPMASKPANLHNSAVLRMLEEEESKQRNGQSPGTKRVAWPPPKDAEDEFVEQEAIEEQGGAQFSSKAPGLQKSQPLNNIQQAPVVANTYQQQRPATPQLIKAPQSPVILNKPVSPAFQQQQPSFTPNTNIKNWAPVQSPTSPQPIFPSVPQPYQFPHGQEYKIPIQIEPRPQAPVVRPPQAVPREYQIPIKIETTQAKPQFKPEKTQFKPHTPQEYQVPIQIEKTQPPQERKIPVQIQQQPLQNQAAVGPQDQNQVQQPRYQPAPVKQVEPPPSIITLRPTVPISQAPAPVFFSQPATATLKGGKNLRGDMKWPPENVKERMEAENKQLMELAQGPAVRPRKVKKDYSKFFAQHALNSTYPGYKVPPGTQYYEHQPMM